MIRQGKLDFIVPGYTGHIPKRHLERTKEVILPEKEGHIPGYSGYVPKIKPENLYGRTFG